MVSGCDGWPGTRRITLEDTVDSSFFIVPDLRLTVAMTSSLNPGNGRRRHLRSLYNMVEDQIIPAIQRGYGVE